MFHGEHWGALPGRGHFCGDPPRPLSPRTLLFSLLAWRAWPCWLAPGVARRLSFLQHIAFSLFFRDRMEVRQGPGPFALAACTAAGNRGTGSLALRPSAHRCAISRHSRSSASPRRFDAAAADQGSAGPLDPPQDCLACYFRRVPRRPTLDGPAYEVGLHDLYAGGSAGNPAPCHAPDAAKIG